MSLSPTTIELVARARNDLRMGAVVGLKHQDGIALIAAVETLSEARFADLKDHSDLVITEKRATTLKARAYDGDLCRLELPKAADIRWVKAVADPAEDLAYPMKGPFCERRDGNVGPHRIAIKLCKDARLLPSVLIWENAPSVPDGVTVLDIEEIGTIAPPVNLVEIAQARVPLEVSEAGKLHVFRPDDGGEEHYAVEIGSPDRAQPVLSRLHSACFTGDLLGSLKCDCGPQLRCALHQIGAAGEGVLLYLNQEGRGIGLANKMRAYALQDQGFDTVEANHRLGFEDDERDFRIGAALLQNLGFSAVRLMTNNPAKIEKMESAGVKVVERVPLRVGETPQNADYLATKIRKSGHMP